MMAEIQENPEVVKNDRDAVIGQESGPEIPFPLRIGGRILHGFGRGSKELGVPTANIPVDSASAKSWITNAQSGVYFGWCGICFPPGHSALTSDSILPSSPILPPDFIPPAPRAELSIDSLSQGWRIYPTVMSIGFNPFFKNEIRSAEAHVLNGFKDDFYGSPIRVCLLGFIREEKDYNCLDALIEDIRIDCYVARRSLNRFNWTLAPETRKKDLEWLAGTGES